MDWSRWQGWRGRLTCAKAWAAWQIYWWLPVERMPMWSYLWLLPSVGDYAFRDDIVRRIRDGDK